MFPQTLEAAPGCGQRTLTSPLQGFPGRRSRSFHRRIFAGAISFAAFCCLLASGTPCPAADDSSEASKPIPRVVKSDETLRMDQIKQEVTALFVKRDFTRLEELADKFRKDKRVFASGTSSITVFYRVFSMPPPETSDEDLEKMIGTLQDWTKAKPASVTPYVALAEAWVTFAWKARGNGYGNTVTADGQRLMTERLQNADSTLKQAWAMRQNCPGYYMTAQGVGLGQGWSRDAYDRNCDEGLKRYPDAWGIYQYKSYFLQRRWYGKPGEWEAFVAASADKVGGEEGDLLYARIMGYLGGKTNNVLKGADISWPRVKKGYEVMLRRYPDSLNGMSDFARLACKAEDWETARPLFDKIGDRVVLLVWKNEADFSACRDAAYMKR